MSRALQVGDVIENSQRRVYVVVGFTPYGKTRFRRVPEGTELTTWWSHEHGMPAGYRVVGRSPSPDLGEAA